MRLFLKLLVVRWLIVLMLLPGLVQAQALPVSSMQKAMSSLIGSNLAKRGVTAANDARYAATFQGVGVGIGSAAAASALVTAAGVTAPAWVTVAATAALGALLAYGADLAIDGLKRIFNPDGSSAGTPTTPPSQRGPDTYSYAGFQGGSAEAVATAYIADFNAQIVAGCQPGYSCTGRYFLERCYAYAGSWTCQLGFTQNGNVETNARNIQVGVSAGVPYTCDGPTINGVCQNPATTVVTGTPSEIVAALSDAEKAKPASPHLVAQIADKAYQYASLQPGYAGVPYDASQPITAADAQAVMQANPASWPTVGDIVSPQAAPSGQPASVPFTVPVPVPVPQPGGSTDPSPGTSDKVEVTNFGNFAAPTLEPTPTVESIVDPLLSLWPSWSNFAFPQHESSCPRPSFTLPGGVMNGATVNFTQMCDFIEQTNTRQVMQAAFAVAWAIVIVFIVMSA